MIEKTGTKIPYGKNLLDLFFGRQEIGESFMGPVLGSRIEIRKDNLTFFK
jgi:hypothetical protein